MTLAPPSAMSARLSSSALMRNRGVGVVDLLERAEAGALRAEVVALLPHADTADRADGRDDVRGDPERRMSSVGAGPVLDRLYGDGRLLATLSGLTGIDWRPLGSHAAYSIYTGGHHLGPHRDIDGCDLTVIVAVYDDTPAGHPLWVWPSRAGAPISAIRAEPLRGRRAAVAGLGQAIVVLGSLVPHELPRLPAGCTRIVAPLCFTAVRPGRPSTN